MLRYLSLLSLLLSSSGLSAQHFNANKMDSLLSLIEQKHKSMGSVSILRQGEEVYQRSIGYANYNEGIKADDGTVYRIGSISKTFTAVIIMQMIEEGKLSLDTKLAHYFPQLPNADKISIEHMLRHRSGLYNFTNKPDVFNKLKGEVSKEQFISIFTENGVEFEPDEKTAYSNTNFVLLSLIAEEEDDMAFEQILHERIAMPLQFKDTYIASPHRPAQREAFSYYRKDDWIQSSQSNLSIAKGAGAISSTPEDVNRFLTALFTYQILDSATVAQMTRLKDNFGLGLMLIPFYERYAYGHAGRIDAFSTSSAYFEEDSVAISYFANASVMDVNSIMIGILSIYFDKAYEMPTFRPNITLSEAILDQYTGTYSSPAFPLKLKMWREGNTLMGQASGQPSFPLEAIEERVFQFEQAGIILEFEPEKKLMVLKQAGGAYQLSREE
ncbi:serine hydrolase [Porifericola rhodea]|uniref:serine hydrolase domain-containing protein n=1 Tax=Porifericola rhodea TaxID=930972 RepID=UPI002667120A|nr:serine hydrolase domain-containing protein [Porifericola rhodea]WKN30663.1 serine hydrolase [Porifericola rhodea]